MQKCVLLLLAEGGAVCLLTASALWTELFAQLRQKFRAFVALVEVMDHNGSVEEYMAVIQTCKVVAV